MGDFEAAIKASGAVSFSAVLSTKKGVSLDQAGESAVFVIEKKEGADNTKIADLLYQLMPPIKEKKAEDCPKEIDGMLVWHKPDFAMPEPNADRATTFGNAHSNVAAKSSLSAVFVPADSAVEAAKGQLKPEEAALVSAICEGDGICLFTDFAAAAEPSIKLLVLSPDAAGAEKLNKTAQAILDEVKKQIPPPMQPMMDVLKLVQAGSNVQLAVSFQDLSKVAKDLMAMAAQGGK
jgi:hypothetical protein